MVLFLYHFAWTLILILILPLIPFTAGGRLYDRLGLSIPHTTARRKRIWIHALSVGEVISALPLIMCIKKRYPSRAIAFTVKTSQGMEVARDKLPHGVDALFPMPLDSWWSVRRIVRHIGPCILILVETDIWPGLISYLQKRGIKVILVNGRISPRTFKSYRRYRFFIRRILSSIEIFLMQTDLDRKRLRKIGLPEGKVKTVGNMKFDRVWRPMDEKERNSWFDTLHLGRENRIWVAGSTHEGEEEILLDTYKRLTEPFPDLRLVIAPRQLARVKDILRLCRHNDLMTMRRTDSEGDGSRPFQVLILDTMGELDRIYGLAHISFVGGSMVPVGGHNLLEPASFGCPVLFGPHTHNFIQMARLLIEAGGGIRVRDADDLYSSIKELLSDPGRMERMALRAKGFVENNRGAVERVMEYIGEYMDAS